MVPSAQPSQEQRDAAYSIVQQIENQENGWAFPVWNTLSTSQQRILTDGGYNLETLDMVIEAYVYYTPSISINTEDIVNFAMILPLIVVGVEGLGNISTSNPLSGLTYSTKVQQQIELGDNHSFPSLIDSLIVEGDVVEKIGGDSLLYRHIELPGWKNGIEGTFHWVINSDGEITHRLFEIIKQESNGG